MIEDVYEPLERYSREFRQAFAENTSLFFANLIQKSGIDVPANQKLCEKIHGLERDKVAGESKRSWLFAANFIAWFLCLASGGLSVYLLFFVDKAEQGENHGTLVAICLGVFAITLPLIFFKLNPALKAADAHVKKLEEEIAKLKEIAWKQMEPLNALYDWDITTSLMEKTVPRIAFDSFFNVGRLRELQGEFGLNDRFNDDKSVLFSQSGEINGNPFVLADLLKMEWGEETYTGTLEISWTEYERDAEGKMRRVTKHETLHASVTKPKPFFNKESCLIYGNEAAPKLEFSRKPTGLADSDGGFLQGLKKKYELGKLKKFSRNLDDDSNYTMMSNEEFELLFHSTDRNDEVQFRLLFTPLAQRQMIALLKDKKEGYGDDFQFYKDKLINIVFPRHLDSMSLNTNPAIFCDWDLEHARVNFQQFNENYFRAVYFTFAPLLSIPLYQQTRTRRTIYGEPLDAKACFWEHEALANFHGEEKFQHPNCITHNILKTDVLNEHNGISEVKVTAYGFRGIKHIEYVSKLGGEGKFHDVPVEWTEYLPVENAGVMVVSEQPKEITRDDYNRSISDASAWREQLRELGCPDDQWASFRRDIVSFVKGV